MPAIALGGGPDTQPDPEDRSGPDHIHRRATGRRQRLRGRRAAEQGRQPSSSGRMDELCFDPHGRIGVQPAASERSAAASLISQSQGAGAY